jgi:hypothetical protein
MKRLMHICVALLASWYLIRAPKHQSGFWSHHFGMQFADTNAPLSQWSIIGKFEAAPQCEAAIAKRTAKQREGLRCIGSDDPRLAR